MEQFSEDSSDLSEELFRDVDVLSETDAAIHEIIAYSNAAESCMV